VLKKSHRGYQGCTEQGKGYTNSDVVVDCTELNYISSSGMRIFLNVYKHTHGNGHRVILRGVTDDVREVLTLGGFLQLFLTE